MRGRHGEIRVDLEWKMIYVGSAESEEFDQELASVLVGPVPMGLNKFTFTVRARGSSLLAHVCGPPIDRRSGCTTRTDVVDEWMGGWMGRHQRQTWPRSRSWT